MKQALYALFKSTVKVEHPCNLMVCGLSLITLRKKSAKLPDRCLILQGNIRKIGSNTYPSFIIDKGTVIVVYADIDKKYMTDSNIKVLDKNQVREYLRDRVDLLKQEIKHYNDKLLDGYSKDDISNMREELRKLNYWIMDNETDA